MQADDLDPDIQAMKRANRKPLYVALGVVGVLALWVLMGFSSVRSGLEADGYQDVEVTMHTPVEFGFTGKKDGMQCGGTVTRLPIFTSRSQGCFGSSTK